MKTQHTPGPWAYADGRDEFAIKTSDGSTIAYAQNIGDARLIAAAPDLLEALQPFVLTNSSEEFVTLVVRSSDITKARAAIAKATGAKS